MRSAFWLPAAIAFATSGLASEVTVQNDSLADGDSGTIQAGFVAGEEAAAWLTSPCTGNIVAAQIFWRSLFGTAPVSVENAVNIYRSGTYPIPGALAQQILGPVLTDGVLNEYRYLDENNTIPLVVPVVQAETFVLSLAFAEAPDPTQGPSVVNDSDGIEPNRNAIYAFLGGNTYQWFPNTTLGVNGDWVIRAVVDCQTSSSEADVAVTLSADPTEYSAGAALTYTITVDNAGPAASPVTTVVDAFPAAFTGATWTCAASGGASCTASGSGATLTDFASLPAGSQVVYTVDGSIAAGTTGSLLDSATAVVGGAATDPDTTNNTASVTTDPAAGSDDLIFANGFDPPG
jgi:uncharacterized repeat protein (TIGR01451 family)